MAKAQPGKETWRRLLRRGFVATREQFEKSGQLHANLTRLLVENTDNGEAAAIFAQMIAQLDLITVQVFEHQEVYTELWRIGVGGGEPEEIAPHAKGDTRSN